MPSHHEPVVAIDEPLFGPHLAPLESVESTTDVARRQAGLLPLDRARGRLAPAASALILKRIGPQVQRSSREHDIDRPAVVLKEPNSSMPQT